MVVVQVTTVGDPLVRLFPLAIGLVARAQVMGFLPEDVNGAVRLDKELLRRIGAEVEAAGVARDAVPLLRLGETESELEEALRRTLDAIDASPRPEGEWQPAREMLGDELLARVLGDISASSLRRYASGVRATPDDVAWRLHIVARLLASLVGSYNAYGIRRWFDRPRLQLDERTPANVLREADHEHDRDIRTVLALADALVGAGGAT